MTLKKRIATIILTLALIITIGGELFSAFSVKSRAAQSTTYSDVLDDLKKAENFL